MLNDIATLLGFAGISLVVIILILLMILVFEIAMLISAIRNKFITDNVKVIWILGMLLVHPFVAIAYYFTDHKKVK